MDGIHDLGGKQGFGSVIREADEPVFHDRWEGRVFGMALLGGGGSGAQLRSFPSCDRTDRSGCVSEPRLLRSLAGRLGSPHRRSGRTRHRADHAARAGTRCDGRRSDRRAAGVETRSYRLSRASRRAIDAASARRRDSRWVIRFEHKRHGVPGHTRLPAYARGRRGTVVTWHHGWVFPDTNAHGRGENPQHLYTVAFEGTELWGAGSGTRCCRSSRFVRAILGARRCLTATNRPSAPKRSNLC